MNWLTGSAGRTSASGAVRDSEVDYSYVFGNRKSGERHDPHVHEQSPRSPADLRVISDLIREKKAEDQSAK